MLANVPLRLIAQDVLTWYGILKCDNRRVSIPDNRRASITTIVLESHF